MKTNEKPRNNKMKKTKNYRGEFLKKRLMEVSGIQPRQSEREKLINIQGMTYGELFDIIHQSVKDYFDETFESPATLVAGDGSELEIDEELQRILDELDFDDIQEHYGRKN